MGMLAAKALSLCASSHHRNMFDNKKYVEEYRASDVVEQLGLSRPKLIRMAHLLGSDYTTGISGIGAQQSKR